METRPYREEAACWPAEGRHILADYDEESIVVYQAFRPAIAEFAVTHQRFGGAFSWSRMSWIKPGFLWLMHRAGWATKPEQERVLAVRLKHAFFDEILASALHTRADLAGIGDPAAWHAAKRTSEVRLQWDPDHDPWGSACDRRAIQLGLRGEILRRYGTEECRRIEDVTAFVEVQRERRMTAPEELLVPRARVYVPRDRAVARHIHLDAAPEPT